jgi:hypothetical protein
MLAADTALGPINASRRGSVMLAAARRSQTGRDAWR